MSMSRHVMRCRSRMAAIVTWLQTCLPVHARIPADYFGEAFSMPRSLSRRWQAALSRDDLLAAGFHGLRPPRLTLRVNLLRATVSEVREALAAREVSSTPGPRPGTLILESSSRGRFAPRLCGGALERPGCIVDGGSAFADAGAWARKSLTCAPPPVEKRRSWRSCAATGWKSLPAM